MPTKMRVSAGLLLLGLCTCHIQVRAPRPSAALGWLEYAEALERDQPRRVYTMLAKETQASVPLSRFIREWRDLSEERNAQAREIRQRLRAPVPLCALVTAQSGTQVVLSLDSARDRFLLPELDFRGARPATPEQALVLLLHAVESRDMEAVLRLLTPPKRQIIEDEMVARMTALKDALTRRKPLDVHGDRARYQYDPRFFIDLRREQGVWRIHDLN